MKGDLVGQRSPRVILVPAVETANIGPGIGNTLCIGVEENAGDEAASTTNVDILPRERGVGRGRSRSREKQMVPHGRSKMDDSGMSRKTKKSHSMAITGGGST